MRKVILDFRSLLSRGEVSRREIHDYIAAKMNFPEYYGHNLDALYDCLTDIREPTAVGIAMPEKTGAGDPDGSGQDSRGQDSRGRDRDGQGSVLSYLEKVGTTFRDAEKDNPGLAVLEFRGDGGADGR